MKAIPTFKAYLPGELPFKALDENLMAHVKADHKTAQQRLLEILHSTPRPRNNYLVTVPGWLLPETDSVVVDLKTSGSLLHYYNKVRFILEEVLENMGIFPAEERFLYAFRAPERYLLSTKPRIQNINWWETHSP